jgi:two-component system, NarL family, sensor kinase
MNDSDLIFFIAFPTVAIIILIMAIVLGMIKSSRDKVKHEAELAKIELTYQKELREADIEVGEFLRSQFARELHDNIGHTLTYMRLHIENGKLDSPAAVEVFRPIESLLDNASEQVRMLSRSMNSDYLSQVGFSYAVKMECDRLQKISGTEILLKEGETELISGQKDRELMAFRIFQEIITNNIKHSKASKMEIVLNVENTILGVSDNGKGFDVEATLNSNHASGIKNILKRAQLAGFSCEINSKPSHGCSYFLKLI